MFKPILDQTVCYISVISIEEYRLILQTNSRLSWRCVLCVKNCILVNADSLQNVLESEFSDTITSLKIEIKTEMIKQASIGTPSFPLPVKYADFLKDKSQPAIIIYSNLPSQPKDSSKPLSQTKQDIMRNIEPTTENFQPAKIKTAKDGGLLI